MLPSAHPCGSLHASCAHSPAPPAAPAAARRTTGNASSPAAVGAQPNPGCASSRDGRLQFNTAVAFDSDGAFVAKAHKQNLWGE